MLLAISFLLTSTAFASEEQSNTDDSSVENLSSAGILPTNPFYFMESFGRGMKRGAYRIFSNSPFKKFELEEQIQEKAVLEIRKMISMEIDNPSAVEKSISAFKESLGNMKEVSSSLSEENINDLSDSISRMKSSWARLRRFVNSGKIEIDGVSDLYSDMSEILKNLNS